MLLLRGYRPKTGMIALEVPIPRERAREAARHAFVPEDDCIVRYPIPSAAARSIMAMLGMTLRQEGTVAYFLEDSTYETR